MIHGWVAVPPDSVCARCKLPAQLSFAVEGKSERILFCRACAVELVDAGMRAFLQSIGALPAHPADVHWGPGGAGRP